MVATASTERVGKRCDCDWNRYCAFVGDFRPERLVALGMGRSLVVGRCYACGRFICNRCADRSEVDGVHVALAEFGLARLVCPFDGETLGRDDTWVVVGASRQVVEAGAALTTWAVAEAAVDPHTPVDPVVRASLGSAVAAVHAGAYADALAACAGSPGAGVLTPAFRVIQRVSLERSRRFDDAWRVQEVILGTPSRDMILALGVLCRLLPRDDPGTGIVVNELVASIRDDRAAVSQKVEAAVQEVAPAPSPPLAASAARANAGPGDVDAVTRRIVTTEAPSAALLVGETLALLCWTRGDDHARTADVRDAIAARNPPVDPMLVRHATDQACAGPDGAWFRADGRDGIAFVDSSVERAFLARALVDRLFAPDRPDLKLVGLRPLERETARLIACAIQDSADRRARLDEWQRFDRGRRSLFRGANVPVLARNFALVRLSLTGEVREIDLSEADFGALDLSHADFSMALVEGASFRGATLRGACFRGARITGADFTGADVTGAVLDR